MKSGEDKRIGKGDNSLPGSSQNDSAVTQKAIAVMALLRNDKKKAVQQVKHMIKVNKELAYAVLTSDVDGWTPLHACALRGSKTLLKTMLKAGVSVNLPMGQPEGLPGGCTLLHVAANRMDKKVLDYLLHHGADVNARDSDGNTALFYARQSNKDSVRLLVNCGAKLDDRHSSNINHNNHSNQPQQCRRFAKETPRHLHSSSPNLKHDVQQQFGTIPAISFHHIQQIKQHIKKPWARVAGDSSLSSTAKPTMVSESQFLTVPPVKYYSSSPCLHLQENTSKLNSRSLTNSTESKFTNSTESIGLPCIYSNKICGHANNNNNNAAITDLNVDKSLKESGKIFYSSSESQINRSNGHIIENNSD